MNLPWVWAIILPVFCQHSLVPAFQSFASETPQSFGVSCELSHISAVLDIPPPPDFKRINVPAGSFGSWLRKVSIKKSNTVFLYNGMPKRNQHAQFAVLDISTGTEDLQQCADAVMRLRAEYLYQHGSFSSIVFTDNAGKKFQYRNGNNRAAFDRYLRLVFSYCGTASLAKQLKTVNNIENIVPGDVFIKGGFPGHAAIVMDVAVNRYGEKCFLLAQSYMPAQDIHILKNSGNGLFSPWYKVADCQPLVTPEWIFHASELKRW